MSCMTNDAPRPPPASFRFSCPGSLSAIFAVMTAPNLASLTFDSPVSCTHTIAKAEVEREVTSAYQIDETTLILKQKGRGRAYHGTRIRQRANLGFALLGIGSLAVLR